MFVRSRPAVGILTKFAAAVVIVCLFGYNLSAVADPPPWVMRPNNMSEKEVHDFVKTAGVGVNVLAEVSSSASGSLQFSSVGGEIASISDTSVDLKVRVKGKTVVQTYAYKDILEIHESPAGKKHQLLALVIIAGVATALLVIVLHHHPPAKPAGGPA